MTTLQDRLHPTIEKYEAKDFSYFFKKTRNEKRNPFCSLFSFGYFFGIFLRLKFLPILLKYD